MGLVRWSRARCAVTSTNQRCLTASKRIRSALEVAEHLRSLFSTPDWLQKHKHMKINEIVVMYIDKDETDPVIRREFQCLVGALLYCSTCTRPDIAFSATPCRLMTLDWIHVKVNRPADLGQNPACGAPNSV